MPDSSPLLSLPYLLPSQAQKHVTHNEALDLLDMLVQPVVEAVDAVSPPSAPVEGEVWAVGAAPSGAWTGRGLSLASWRNGGWIYLALKAGWTVWSRDAGAVLAFDGGTWGPLGGGLQNLDGVGVNTSSDAVNRLAVASGATLLTHEGAGHQLKINKATVADTASLLFQTGWSGRAEMGLAGSDGFSIKVSDDGASFVSGLVVQTDTVRVDLPLSGSAVQAGATDATPGRVMTTGAFGLGAGAGVSAPSDDADLCLSAGLAYRFTAAGTHTPVAPAGGSLVVTTGTGGAVQQMFMAADGTRVWVRGRAAGAPAWGAWQRVLTNDLILGTVSQAAGVPTGAVIETGSNSNGTWTRFADGAMQCIRTNLSATNISTADGAIFRSANVGWNYPASFVSAPVVTGAADDLDAWLSVGAPSATGCTARLKSSVSKTAAVGFRLVAHGRWF